MPSACMRSWDRGRCRSAETAPSGIFLSRARSLKLKRNCSVYSEARSWAACAFRAAAPWRRPPRPDPIMLLEIGAHLRDRQRTQAVVAAQFQISRSWDGASSARAADAPGPPAVVSPLTLALTTWYPYPWALSLVLQQCHPALFYVRQPVARADAIAEHENHRCLGPGRDAMRRSTRTGPKAASQALLMQDQIVLEAKNVSKTVASPAGPLTILADVSLSVRTGETSGHRRRFGRGQVDAVGAARGTRFPEHRTCADRRHRSDGTRRGRPRAHCAASMLGSCFSRFI